MFLFNISVPLNPLVFVFFTVGKERDERERERERKRERERERDRVGGGGGKKDWRVIKKERGGGRQ